MIELLAAPEPEKVCHKICVTRRRTGNLGLSSRVTFCAGGSEVEYWRPKPMVVGSNPTRRTG